MKPEDIQRIDQAANYQYDAGLLSNRSDFKTGAKYEHPIAWNAALDELKKNLPDEEVFITEPHKFYGLIIDEIQKLKK